MGVAELDQPWKPSPVFMAAVTPTTWTAHKSDSFEATLRLLLCVDEEAGALVVVAVLGVAVLSRECLGV